MEFYLYLLGFIFTLGSFADAEIVVSGFTDGVGYNLQVSLTCTASGDEKFSKWVDVDRNTDLVVGGRQNNGVQVYEITEVTKDSKYKLTFYNVNEKYCGTYRCQGTKTYAEKDLTLRVEFDSNNCKSTQGIVKGTTDSVNCPIFSCPTSKHKVKWLKKKETGTFEDITNGRFSFESNGKMTVRDVQLNDAGSYRITFETERTEDSEDITVEVNVPPEINTTVTRDVYSYIGNPKKIKLECKASGSPVPDVEITKNGNKVNYYGFVDESPGYYSVEFKLEAGDEDKFAEYICTATNVVKSVTHSFKLEKAEEPVLTRVNATVTGNLNGDTSLSCSSSGKPYPKFEWYFKGLQLYDSEKYEVKNDIGEKGELVIRKTKNSDIGEYKCYGENLLGNVTGYRIINRVEEIDKGARGEAALVMISVKVWSALLTLCLAFLLS